jgi:predicted DNA-binding protein with PD1-like motif
MPSAEWRTGRCVTASLDADSDLQTEIERLAVLHAVAFGEVRAIGSLDRVAVTYYDQAAKEDRDIVLERPMMLLAAAGTVVAGEQGPQAHVHLTVADETGVASGGDLSPGCLVFSVELVLQELLGGQVSRRSDATTGLARLHFG